MENGADIRRRVLVDGLSKRAACREFDIQRDTLTKVLDHPEPPGYRRKAPRPEPRLDPFPPVIHQSLEADKKAPRKQRHTARRIFERLRDEHGYEGGLTVVQAAGAAWRLRSAEVFVPLSHPPGEARVDFGEAEVTLDGRAATVALFVMTLPYSDATFVRACPRECTEAFLEGHVRAFAFFDGVPRRISYDNFEGRCREDLARRLRGKPAAQVDLRADERAAFLPPPSEAFVAARVEPRCVDSLSLASFDANQDSVPTEFAHHRATVVATVDDVRIVVGGRVAATHRRCWGRERVPYEPVHYPALLERKPGALDFAAPRAGWELPVCFGALRRRLEAESGGPGTRQFIEVLRLLERAGRDELTRAGERAGERGVADADAVRPVLEHRREQPAGPFRLDGRPHPELVAVPAPDLSAYASLAAGVAS